MSNFIISDKRLSQIISEAVDKITNKTLIIFHGIDWDGYTSAAIAYLTNPNADLLPWNYGLPLPDTTPYRKVILVDLTISVRNDYTWMEENADKLIWIDHHAAAIRGVKNTSIEGVRADGIGACVLTWDYFFPNKRIPLHVALAGSYDVFRKDGKYVSWDDAWNYQLALSQMGNSLENAINLVNKAIEFIKEPINITQERIAQGQTLEHDRSQAETERFKQAQFVKRGNITICKLVADGQAGLLIHNNIDNHTADLFVLRSSEPIKGDPTKFQISLRVPETSNVDASAIARQYGGNGHIKAAGCIMTIEEFENL